MLPTLRPGKIIVGFKTKKIHPGDVVVIRHNGLEKTKRVKYIKSGRIFVLGDNAAHSTDSRAFGWLKSQDVEAKVVWPRQLVKQEDNL